MTKKQENEVFTHIADNVHLKRVSSSGGKIWALNYATSRTGYSYNNTQDGRSIESSSFTNKISGSLTITTHQVNNLLPLITHPRIIYNLKVQLHQSDKQTGDLRHYHHHPQMIINQLLFALGIP